MPAHDVNARVIAYAGCAIALTVMAVVIAVFLLLRHWDLAAVTDRARLPYDLVMPGPALQSAPQEDLAQYRARKQQWLHSGAPVDASQGIARIPITEAMDLLAQPAAAAASVPTVRP